ncbi:hypothetical protein X743_32245 [Mesorhizobium sp. LNHC252B00]|nr:hypothetical protein X743_32245 [Mesorhizobium sp. LNHC252B00]
MFPQILLDPLLTDTRGKQEGLRIRRACAIAVG